MAKRVKVKLDSERGMAAFLRGPEVRTMVRASADRIAAAAGPGYETDTWISPSRGTSRRGFSNPPRAVAGVMAESFEARRDNSRNNTLLRSRDAGRT